MSWGSWSQGTSTRDGSNRDGRGYESGSKDGSPSLLSASIQETFYLMGKQEASRGDIAWSSLLLVLLCVAQLPCN
jgi:hypothetical protein